MGSVLKLFPAFPAAWNSIVAHALDPVFSSGCLVISKASATINAADLSVVSDQTSVARVLSASSSSKASPSSSLFDPVQEKIRQERFENGLAAAYCPQSQTSLRSTTTTTTVDNIVVDCVSTRDPPSSFDPV